MKTKHVHAIKLALLDMLSQAAMVKMFLPSRADKYIDVPCLSDAVRELRSQVSNIEDLLELEFPGKPGEDILWRSVEFEVPSHSRPVLVSRKGYGRAIVACWIDATWCDANGVPLFDNIYAWTELPASCFEQRERLMLEAPVGGRRAS